VRLQKGEIRFESPWAEPQRPQNNGCRFQWLHRVSVETATAQGVGDSPSPRWGKGIGSIDTLAAHGNALIETKKRTHQRASRCVQEDQVRTPPINSDGWYFNDLSN
jgi:hypothetical protein